MSHQSAPLTQGDYDAILRAARDYVDGWYDGDGGRMARSLHPDLVKRTLVREGDSWIVGKTSTRDFLVECTRDGGGTEVPEKERVSDVAILDVFRDIAVVKALSPHYMDYLQLARFGEDDWRIVNVLWQMREGEYRPE